MKNSITINDKLILKNEEKLHSHSWFSIYVINNIRDKNIPMIVENFFCHTCGRTYIFYSIKNRFFYIIYTNNKSNCMQLARIPSYVVYLKFS